jgi:hypothetical protein
MSIIELNETYPKCIQPKNLQIKLKDHQLTINHRMMELESTGEIKRTIKSCIYKFRIYTEHVHSYWMPEETRNYSNIDYTVRTNFGILADKVGAGKTYEIIGLLCNNLVPPDRNKIISTSIYSSLEYKDPVIGLKTNLILVPHNLVTQWKKAFSQCNLKTFIIAKKSDINFLVYPENVFDNNNETNENLDDLDNITELNTIEYYDVIVCSATMFEEYFEKFKSVKYGRIIIDEVCSIKLPTDLNFMANFIWFVTATPSGIKYLKRFYIKDIINNMHNFIFDNLIIKNSDDYVGRSMELPNINQILIKCFTPKQFEMVREFVPQEVMDMLNAGNMKDAVVKLNCNVDTNEGILQVLTNKISNELHNTKQELSYKESIIPTDKKAHDEQILRIKNKINSLQTKFDSISQRINDFMKESCPICLEDFESVVPGVLPCCNQLYCIACLAQIKNTCPTCRTTFTMDKINVIMNDGVDKNKKQNEVKEKSQITKIDALIKLLKDKPKGRFLLFSNYDQTFENLKQRMTEEGIKFSRVIGSGSVVNKTIQRFTDGEIRVLMLNAINYGSGLNLQMATDIVIYHQLSLELETQVIGRAQRLGRDTELNVYYLLHEHEENNVTNPTLSLDLNVDLGVEEFENHLGNVKGKKPTINFEIDDVNEYLDETVINIKPKKQKARTTKSKKNEIVDEEITTKTSKKLGAKSRKNSPTVSTNTAIVEL